MEKIIINVCASKDSFGAYSANCDGIFGAGDTIEECKADVLEAIRLIKEELPQERWATPLRGEYTIEWHYDIQSLLFHYGTIISLSGLEKITGIHQKQLWAYMHGRSKPRRQQIERIENGIKSFGRELESLAVTE